MVDLLSEPEVGILDETSFPKEGDRSVGVARQYCGTLGNVANCQVAVNLHWSSAEASCPLSWRLFLPKEWVKDWRRAAQVKLQEGIAYQSKTELALELIDQARQWQVPALPVVADSGYGNEFDFRQQLRPRDLPYVVEVEPSTVVRIQDPPPLAGSKINGTAAPLSPAGGPVAAPELEGGGCATAKLDSKVHRSYLT